MRSTLIESVTSPTQREEREPFDFSSVKWAWAGRRSIDDLFERPLHLLSDHAKPRPGDVALVQVERVRHHSYLETDGERRLRLYKGDHLVCVFGNRYATDVY